MTERTNISDISPLGPELDEGQLGLVAGARPSRVKKTVDPNTGNVSLDW